MSAKYQTPGTVKLVNGKATIRYTRKTTTPTQSTVIDCVISEPMNLSNRVGDTSTETFSMTSVRDGNEMVYTITSSAANSTSQAPYNIVESMGASNISELFTITSSIVDQDAVFLVRSNIADSTSTVNLTTNEYNSAVPAQILRTNKYTGKLTKGGCTILHKLAVPKPTTPHSVEIKIDSDFSVRNTLIIPKTPIAVGSRIHAFLIGGAQEGIRERGAAVVTISGSNIPQWILDDNPFVKVEVCTGPLQALSVVRTGYVEILVDASGNTTAFSTGLVIPNGVPNSPPDYRITFRLTYPDGIETLGPSMITGFLHGPEEWISIP